MSQSNIIYYLLKEFSIENKWSIILLIIMSIGFGILQTNGISEIISQIIDSFKDQTNNKTWYLFYTLIFLYIIYQVSYYYFYDIKSKLVTKMKPWARFKLLDVVMQVNNDVFSEINFTRLNSPIHRIADLIAAIIADIMAYMIPNIIYLIIIGVYFFLISPTFAFIFLIGNILIGIYYYFTFESVLEKNKDFEDQTQQSDGAMIDLLSNMDKIIYRGKTKEESSKFEDLQNKSANAGMDYYLNSNLHSSIMLSILTIVFLISLGFLIKLRMTNKIDQIKFMSSFTILMLFREKLTSVVEQLPDFIGYIGRMDIALKYFDHINDNFERVMQKNRFKKKELNFKHIKFENVTYKYSSGKNVYKNRNYDIKLKPNEIVGITGPSGSGKSTFIKLLIKMYPCNKGNILIDGVNIDNLDPSFIRENITYVNQNSKLFDKKVIENMLYGCNDPDKCKNYLSKIMKYPTISKLYKNMDIYKKEAGLLGENLSGGQRQIVNMIGGFINPSKILVLDEPTNALDPTLKKEIIGLIQDFKQYKQNIIIITHDRDVMSLFDTEIKMKAE